MLQIQVLPTSRLVASCYPVCRLCLTVLNSGFSIAEHREIKQVPPHSYFGFVRHTSGLRGAPSFCFPLLRATWP